MGLLEDAMGGAAPGYCPPWDAEQPLPVGVGSGAPRGKRDRSKAEAFSRTCWWPDRDPVPDSPPACRWHLSSHGGGTRGETSDGAVLPQGLAGNSAGLRGRAGSIIADKNSVLEFDNKKDDLVSVGSLIFIGIYL